MSIKKILKLLFLLLFIFIVLVFVEMTSISSKYLNRSLVSVDLNNIRNPQIKKVIRKLDNIYSQLDTSVNQKHNKISVDYNVPKDMIASITEHSNSNDIRYDVLINNSGGPPPGNLFDHNEKVWNTFYHQNLLSFINLNYWKR